MSVSELDSVLEELKAREPIFHHPELGVTRADLEAQIDADFWEVGASGACYARERVISTVAARYGAGAEADTEAWKLSDCKCRQLGPDTYMFTYTLDQDGRASRRLTLWRRAGQGWTILYHQGTLVA